MTDQQAGDDVTEQRISKAIEEWYSAAWHRGVRMSGVERILLARFLAQREPRHG
jgi:hypothetical protein